MKAVGWPHPHCRCGRCIRSSPSAISAATLPNQGNVVQEIVAKLNELANASEYVGEAHDFVVCRHIIEREFSS